MITERLSQLTGVSIYAIILKDKTPVMGTSVSKLDPSKQDINLKGVIFGQDSICNSVGIDRYLSENGEWVLRDFVYTGLKKPNYHVIAEKVLRFKEYPIFFGSISSE
jgi:hypothetical protein